MGNLAQGNQSQLDLNSKYENKHTDLFAFSKDQTLFGNIAEKLKFLGLPYRSIVKADNDTRILTAKYFQQKSSKENINRVDPNNLTWKISPVKIF